MKITSIKAIEILDSRGNPTVRTFIELEDGSRHSSSVPSGASTGSHEAVELRDGDAARYNGKGVLKAVENVNTLISQALTGIEVTDPAGLDKKMLELDGTENKSKLGANAILSVSQAVLKAAAHSQNIPLWKFINNYYFSSNPEPTEGESRNYLNENSFRQPAGRAIKPSFPRLMVNVINGGKHAGWNFDIQEFMIIPKPTIPSESVKMAAEIFHSLGKELKNKGFDTLIGDEGGYSPALSSNEEVLETIISSAKTINCEASTNYDLALDCAATEWYENGQYVSRKTGDKLSDNELREKYLKLQEAFHILSFEDPFAEDNWEAWREFTAIANNRHAELVLASRQTQGSNKVLNQVQNDIKPTFMVVGDDLYATNMSRIRKGIEIQAANAVLIKPNQIGTISETVEAIKMTRNAGWKFIISHRSGETEDSFIADLAYGSGADFIKTGSMSRSERLAKYNRLLEVENNL